MQKLTIQFNC